MCGWRTETEVEGATRRKSEKPSRSRTSAFAAHCRGLDPRVIASGITEENCAKVYVIEHVLINKKVKYLLYRW